MTTCPNCESKHAYPEHCPECNWQKNAPRVPPIDDKWLHDAQCRLLRARTQDGLGYASDDSARFAGRAIKQLREQVAGLDVALKSQIEITNTERAAKERAEATIRSARPEALRIPDGWKLVPIEPTDAMLNAVDRRPFNQHLVRANYMAMCAAASVPSPLVPRACCGKFTIGGICVNDCPHKQSLPQDEDK